MRLCVNGSLQLSNNHYTSLYMHEWKLEIVEVLQLAECIRISSGNEWVRDEEIQLQEW